jgi:hypothetical protein
MTFVRPKSNKLVLQLSCLLIVLSLAVTAFARRGGSAPGSPAAAAGSAPPTAAQDAGDLLVLRFNGSPNGEQGETPLQSTGVTFTGGVSGQGVLIDGSDVLRYATAGNFNATAGSVEFWIKPLWNGNEGVTRCFFSVGGGDLILVKDGANNFRFIFKQDDSEAFRGHNLGSWPANQWHHVAVTWAVPGAMKTYLDGNLVISHPASAQDLLSPAPADLAVGSRNGAQPVARFVGDGQLVVGNITPAGGESIEAAGNVRTRGEFVQYQASCGGELRVKKFEELVTLAAAAYTDTAATVPGDAIILAVSGRVVAADGDGNVSSFSIGQAGDATAFDSGVLNIAGVTFKGTDSGPLASPNNRAVRITPSAAPASGARGQIRVVVYYVAVTPPAF